MNKEELKKYFQIDNKSGYKTKEINFKKKFINIYNIIILNKNFNNWNEKLYAYLYDIKSIPICKNINCSNHVKFSNNINLGYRKYCSVKCRNTDINLIEKTKKLNIKKYGVTNPMKCLKFIEKGKKTKLERYGDENYNNKDKEKKTKLERYGDEYYNNREKVKQTNLKKYGVEYYTNNEKTRKTKLLRYNNQYYNNLEKMEKTSLNKYGKTHYNNREKAKNTFLKKYGYCWYAQTNEYKIKLIEKTIKKCAEKLNTHINNIDFNNDIFYIRNYCKKHNIFEINRYVLKNRLIYGIKNICTKCNPVSEQSSIKEKELKEFIKSLNINFEEKNRIILNGKELDVYIPDHKLAIEFDGLYYHSDKYYNDDYHLNKTEECEKQGIQLIHIFEDEWIYKSDIIKNIIKSKLELIENIIYASDCEIKEIKDNQLVKTFLENNHIQGYIYSSIKIGLFYNNELVSLMTFSKKRKFMNSKLKKDEYKLLRFCNKLNITVNNGGDKLFKYFNDNYKPQNIITYANRRYSNGDFYKKLGFEYIGKTKPNYFYFKRSEYGRKYRFNFRKSVLVKQGYDPNKTEHEIMLERGYLRIYDCGDYKFEYIFNKS